MKKYELLCVDLESTGLDFIKHEPVEISIIRLSNGEQRTWHLKPINTEDISPDALRVNGLKLDDLLGKTKEGRELYREPSKVLVEIENWLMEDFMAAEDRILIGQNLPGFDKPMLESLWKKCNSYETFPFNKKYSLDTMNIEFMLDLAKGEFAEGYNLHALTKKYGVKNEKAHSAAADTKATAEVFNEQISYLKKLINAK
jgi:DNA polymerase III epsilon subunit-like protein